MHAYSVDSDERRNVTISLALMSLVLTYVVLEGVKSIGLQLPWFIGPPSVLGFYGILLYLFDKLIWKWSFLRKVGAIRTPDLNGEWIGSLKSSYDTKPKIHEIKMKITQDWSRISIKLETDESHSLSQSASILCKDLDRVVLSYQYLNQPRALTASTMESHGGTADLDFLEGNSLKGDYYTGRGRKTVGEIEVHRKAE